MPLTSLGIWQKPAMLFCYAGWNKAKLKVGQRLKQIDHVRRAHAHWHVTTTHSTSQNMEKTHGNGKTVPCVYFNKGSCLQKQSHKTRGIFYKHMCAYCWQRETKAFPHTQTECKKMASKIE